MRLIDLFEDMPTLPGLTPTINLSGIKTVPATPTANTDSTIQTINGQPQIDPAVNQKLSTTGSTFSIPTGPNKTPTNLKISAINNQTGNVTLTNPLTPNQPGMSYSKLQLAQILGNKA
jgi:hypothetical protein